ncbi:MAG: hypothetical protein GX493_07225 [Firmicutes bacterium]|nr:hypothetical protein [Bacillota bacterium]
MDPTVVVVTGANDGIGFHMTRAFLADGYCVAGLDLADENLHPLLAANPGRLLEFSDEDWEEVVATILKGTFLCAQEFARF